MGRINLHVRNFRAIESADIELADLTVLAGVNSSGKTTLARLFHRLVCIEADYDGYAAQCVHSEFIEAVAKPLSIVLSRTDRGYNKYSDELKWLITPKWQLVRKFDRLLESLRSQLKHILNSDWAMEIVSDPRFVGSLNSYMPQQYADVPRLHDSGRIDEWIDALCAYFAGRYSIFAERGKGSSSLFFTAEVAGSNLNDVGSTGYEGTLFEDVFKDIPQVELSISEDDIQIVDLHGKSLPMGRLFSPRLSFYIARPSVDFPTVTVRKLRLNGIDYSYEKDRSAASDMSIVADIGIEALMGGKISAPKGKKSVSASDWIYSDGQNAFDLLQCADGIKSLATLSILDRYGFLKRGTLLIIDEPEVHLHPQWIVGMARVLVRLAKERGVRVLVTTHSPDFVHALRDFSENEDFSSNTCFYLSQQDDKSARRYKFVKLGMNIGPIFSVFNVAKEHIQAISRAIREGGRK